MLISETTLWIHQADLIFKLFPYRQFIYIPSFVKPFKSTEIDKIPAKIIRIASLGPVIVKSIREIFNKAIISEVVQS
jgi:hypothetical protein